MHKLATQEAERECGRVNMCKEEAECERSRKNQCPGGCGGMGVVGTGLALMLGISSE